MALKNLIKEHISLCKLPGPPANTVLLTFDDGPHPEFTPKILALLHTFSAKAVFFVPGIRGEGNVGLLQQIISMGHVVGNHSYGHSKELYKNINICYNDILNCQNFIQNHTGEKPHLYRPPFGRLCVPSIVAAKLLGLKIVTWSIESGEYNKMRQATAQEIADTFVSNVKPNDIALLHDDNERVVAALTIILPALLDKGFTFFDPAAL